MIKLYVVSCPVCGNTVVYDNYEESITAEFCPHCLRRKKFESDIGYDYNVKMRYMDSLKKCKEIEHKYCTVKRPNGLL